ncbi:hypothetical protein DYI24_21870 [Rhodopseudomonas sp. BR0C11]|uniref:hypothetical protein n=1 Tax=Rhodopseudomonas sp. BR0C11 TaxID=2269370 RepID=UPI0013DEC6C6|nr:hypothetical protein [Rhodopseudomonas sp. BR0C11]NEV79685.1 hypothetical protein [Rhodopseudomonas sp. BR0C11]
MSKLHPRVNDMPQGDGWKVIGTALRSDGQVMDLTGAAIEWALVNNKAVTLARAVVGDGITITDAPAGKFEIVLSPGATGTIAAGQHEDYLRVTLPGAAPQTLWRGPFEVAFSPFKSVT